MTRHVAFEDLDIAAWDESHAEKAALVARIGKAIALPFVALAEAVKTRRALQDVLHLTERELADIGAPPELVARIQAARPIHGALADGWR